MDLVSRITEVITAIGVAIKGKQDNLVSGTNIKTINSQSLLGSGNIVISGGGGGGALDRRRRLRRPDADRADQAAGRYPAADAARQLSSGA